MERDGEMIRKCREEWEGMGRSGCRNKQRFDMWCVEKLIESALINRLNV